MVVLSSSGDMIQPYGVIVYIVFHLPHMEFIVLLLRVDLFHIVPAKEDKRGQISGRLPNHLYNWLDDMVCDPDHPDREYPNLNQALIGELTKAKALAEVSGNIEDLKRRVEALEKIVRETKP